VVIFEPGADARDTIRAGLLDLLVPSAMSETAADRVQFSFDVFLSHSSKDKPVVRPVAERLKADGLRVWFDEWELHPGDSIPAKIEDGLEHSRVLVLCMSGNAFGSDWAQLESSTFRFRDPLNKERRFIPLRLDEAPIKGSLAQFLYIKWRLPEREQEYTKLLEACRPPAEKPLAETEAVSTQLAERVVQIHCGNVMLFACAFSPDGKRVLSGSSEDSVVRLWDIETEGCLRLLEGHTSRVNHVAWSADSRLALSGSEDNTMRLWDLESGRCLRVLEGHGIWSAAWSSNQSRVLSGGLDKTVRLWDLERGRCLRVLEGHTDVVYCVAWSADQRYALSGSEDKTLRLWDLEKGHCLRVLEGHTGPVYCVAWSAINDTPSPVLRTKPCAYGT